MERCTSLHLVALISKQKCHGQIAKRSKCISISISHSAAYSEKVLGRPLSWTLGLASIHLLCVLLELEPEAKGYFEDSLFTRFHTWYTFDVLNVAIQDSSLPAFGFSLDGHHSHPGHQHDHCGILLGRSISHLDLKHECQPTSKTLCTSPHPLLSLHCMLSSALYWHTLQPSWGSE